MRDSSDQGAPTPRPSSPARIGTAGWSIPKEHAAPFPATGPHLERYAKVLNAVEINSSFYRLHGSPRMYYSAYSPEALSEIAERLASDAATGIEAWCIFDNTAAFAAAGDALTAKSLVQARC